MPTIDPNITLVLVAFLNFLTAFLAWRTHQITKDNASTIVELEKNTNSIKDALVAATGKASFAAGETKAREAGEAAARALLDKEKKS